MKKVINKIFNEDCLIGMKRIPDGSVDMILCDLPYGVLKSKNNPHTKWDTVIPFDLLWEQYERIIKPNGAIALTAVQPFATDLINSNRKLFKDELIWCKSRASGFLNARKRPNKSHENVLIFYKKQPTYTPQKYKIEEQFIRRMRNKTRSNNTSKAFNIRQNPAYKYVDDGTRFPDSLLEFKSVYRKGMHPTEKPIELFAWLIRSYSRSDDVILDNCMGSGTTALACIAEGRNYIGFEQNEEYFCMALERIERLKSRL